MYFVWKDNFSIHPLRPNDLQPNSRIDFSSCINWSLYGLMATVFCKILQTTAAIFSMVRTERAYSIVRLSSDIPVVRTCFTNWSTNSVFVTCFSLTLSVFNIYPTFFQTASYFVHFKDKTKYLRLCKRHLTFDISLSYQSLFKFQTLAQPPCICILFFINNIIISQLMYICMYTVHINFCSSSFH